MQAPTTNTSTATGKLFFGNLGIPTGALPLRCESDRDMREIVVRDVRGIKVDIAERAV